jgi:cell division protein FtsN
MSPSERMQFYKAKIDRVTPWKTAYEQRMCMVYEKLIEEDRQLLKKREKK